uniref:Uncharacterized protein n=1 Tax=Anguilla anguilla TaxID=7936 RepID=A0A0E9PUV7_ANGAN
MTHILLIHKVGLSTIVKEVRGS